ncbi:MAG: PH domain-containing protein [Thermoplasmata archaeon]|nr:MAG: PH domain-containing protein [Thermoplasmata archaeon]
MTAANLDEATTRKLEHVWTDKTPDHLDPDVKRYWRWIGVIISHLYMFMLFPIIFISSLGLCLVIYIILLGGLGIFLFIYTNLLYESYTFLLTDDMVIIEKGVIWKRKNAIPYSRVQNVNITHNPLERILGIATVHIHTAGMGMAYAEGKIPGIPFPDELAEIILRKVRMYKYGEGLDDDIFGGDVDRFLHKFREFMMSKGRNY